MHSDVSTYPTASSPRWALVMLAAALAMLVASGIQPHDRAGWLLENMLPVALLAGLSLAWHWWRLSAQSYFAMLLLFGVHELGAHFTYAEVPYDEWARQLSGQSLDQAMEWRRNQYDRLVHFSYGLLFVLPIREVLARLTPLRGAWLLFVAWHLVLSTSAIYELIEWVGGAYLGDDQAEAFLATQEDPWDAQKDMALAALGAGISLAALALVSVRRGP
ncbi:MAG TPA: DUF2238 domain-containing protein [Pseudomonas sp.]|nr:DUF2238 domain-containing protein [Pseudomonas sp.]